MVKSYLDYVAQETPPSFSAAAENSPRRTTFITATVPYLMDFSLKGQINFQFYSKTLGATPKSWEHCKTLGVIPKSWEQLQNPGSNSKILGAL